MSKKIKPIDGETILKRLRRLSEYIGTGTRHFLETTKDRTKNLGTQYNLSKATIKKVWNKEGREALLSNMDVSHATKHAKKLMEGNIVGQKILKASHNKWFRKSVYGVAISVGAILLERTVNRFNPQPVIPKNYERGYDIMNETMTDFGSPVKLDKTSSKTITPYHSSIRKGTVTNTNTITNSNLSLALSKQAIGHTRY